jgi:hypothetical protein
VLNNLKPKFGLNNTLAMSETPPVEAHHDPDDDWDETPPEDRPAWNLDTLLQPEDMLAESQNILSVAPGEGNHPLNICIDKHSEVLAFPSIYGGLPRVENTGRETKVYYSNLCKSELRRRDRRVAGHIPNIFFKMKKLQMEHIQQKIQICLRISIGPDKVTAGQLKEADGLRNLIHHDDGFRIFKDLRGSPPYWEKVKKKIIAQIGGGGDTVLSLGEGIRKIML